jgi:hypothetical protein
MNQRLTGREREPDVSRCIVSAELNFRRPGWSIPISERSNMLNLKTGLRRGHGNTRAPANIVGESRLELGIVR